MMMHCLQLFHHNGMLLPPIPLSNATVPQSISCPLSFCLTILSNLFVTTTAILATAAVPDTAPPIAIAPITGPANPAIATSASFPQLNGFFSSFGCSGLVPSCSSSSNSENASYKNSKKSILLNYLLLFLSIFTLTIINFHKNSNALINAPQHHSITL
ncbi:hypothetical protein AWN73_20410 [Clostridium butyricum]|uniref:Uncharacterized protein n=1 Tax=Clostridium butyricum TaxID=1492 RepID=A0A2S7F4P2_CLOBU|nr:hypothetical protein AWN73_20410 [Clostridium butyricum]